MRAAVLASLLTVIAAAGTSASPWGRTTGGQIYKREAALDPAGSAPEGCNAILWKAPRKDGEKPLNETPARGDGGPVYGDVFAGAKRDWEPVAKPQGGSNEVVPTNTSAALPVVTDEKSNAKRTEGTGGGAQDGGASLAPAAPAPSDPVEPGAESGGAPGAQAPAKKEIKIDDLNRFGLEAGLAKFTWKLIQDSIKPVDGGESKSCFDNKVSVRFGLDETAQHFEYDPTEQKGWVEQDLYRGGVAWPWLIDQASRQAVPPPSEPFADRDASKDSMMKLLATFAGTDAISLGEGDEEKKKTVLKVVDHTPVFVGIDYLGKGFSPIMHREDDMITVYDVMTGNMLSFPMDDILSKRLICLKGAETDDAQSGTEGWRVFAESHYN